jgi:hypothetical protein
MAVQYSTSSDPKVPDDAGDLVTLSAGPSALVDHGDLAQASRPDASKLARQA